jgi:DNA end-binding protein Ku
MLHAKDKSPISFERVCQKEGEPVAWQDIVKGFEYEKGRFVVLTKEDFEAAALERSRRIDVLDFVEAEAIDDRFFDKPYYLTPGAGGDEAYALLREAIRDSGRIGVAKFILRDVQHLAAIEAIGQALVVSTLRFADELVDTESLRFPTAKAVRKQDRDLAKTLIDNLSAEWKPEKYKDEYSENLMRVIKARMKGKEARLVADERPRTANVVSLMERLQASLEAAGGKSKPRGRAKQPSKAVRGKKRGRAA